MLMNEKIEIPVGYRRLLKGEEILKGDKFFSVFDCWRETEIGDQYFVVGDWPNSERIYIRKVKC